MANFMHIRNDDRWILRLWNRDIFARDSLSLPYIPNNLSNMHYSLSEYHDRTFHNFRAWKCGDWRILCTSKKTQNRGFISSDVGKCLVGTVLPGRKPVLQLFFSFPFTSHFLYLSNLWIMFYPTTAEFPIKHTLLVLPYFFFFNYFFCPSTASILENTPIPLFSERC